MLEDDDGYQLLEPEFPYHNPRYRYVSNSEIQTFKRCRRKWYLSYFRGLKSKYETPLGPLAIGSRIHSALEQYYVPDGMPMTDPRDALERIITNELTSLNEYHHVTGIPTDIETKFHKETDLSRIIVEGYVEWLGETGADSEFIVVQSEQYQEVRAKDISHFDIMAPYNQRDIKLIARLDVVLKRVSDGAYLFMDHKTLMSFGPAVQGLNQDQQMQMYSVIQRANTSQEEHVAGAVYNMLRKVKRTASARPPFFMRVTVQYNNDQLMSFTKQLNNIINDMLYVEDDLRRAMRTGFLNKAYAVAYPTPTRDCSWQCPFFNVCGMFDDGSRVEDMITEHFTSQDPLAYYAKDEDVDV